MILIDDFFSIRDRVVSATEIWAELIIDSNHKIFEGHFPNQPVVPGVCMMQMVKEIVETVTGKQTNLVKAAEMKFLAVLNPHENNLVQATIKYTEGEAGAINIVASIYKDELVHFKCKIELKEI